MKTESQIKVSLPEVIGRGYGEFWRSRKRYVVCKGSRASKKSTTAALKIIYNMMKYPLSNCLVIRKTAATLKDSCFSQLRWAINRLQVSHLWHATINPLQLTYIPTGQKILFRGTEDSDKIKSITVEHGFINFAWCEEAFEVDFEEFDKIDKSLRAQMPEGYFTQWLITFNPTSSSSWLKSFFFDVPRENVLAMTTTYLCNEFLSEEYKGIIEYTKISDPEKYKVDGLGEWGLEGGRYFSEWRESIHVVKPFKIPQNWIKFRAADWGSFHPYACLWFAVDYDNNLWAYRELYGWGGKANKGTGETATQFAEKIVTMETREEKLSYGVLDNACWAKISGQTIAEEINNVLIKNKLVSFGQSSKGRAEGGNQIKQRLLGNKNVQGEYVPALKIFSNCIHTIRTLPMLSHDQREPEKYDTKGEDHLADCLAYACLSRPFSPVRPKPAEIRDAWREEEPKRSVWTY